MFCQLYSSVSTPFLLPSRFICDGSIAFRFPFPVWCAPMHTPILSAAFALSILFSATAHAQTGAMESSAPERATTSSAPARAGTSSSEPTTADVMMEEEQDSGVNTAVGDVTGDGTDAQEAGADYLLEIDTIKGESKDEKAPGVEPDEIDNKMTDEEAAKKKGNVDYNWKVEEGESMEEDDDGPTAVTTKAEATMPDFSILLGGGDSDEAQEARNKAAELLLATMQENGGDRPVESLSLNFTKIEMKVHDDAKLFGFIPVSIPATVTIDKENKVSVKFPWWSFLVGGKDEEEVGHESANYIGAALIELRDAMKAMFVK